MLEDEPGRGRKALTGRQREITALIARGDTNQQIATELVISPGTVGNHIEQILRRLNLGSRVELATWANQHGLASQNRLLTTLERLLEIDPSDLHAALDAATKAVADALGAEKVDAFLYDTATATLVARGTSPTPLGHKQRALGLHLLPVANGGRMVEVYETGIPRRDGRVDKDLQELRGIRVGLGVRSAITVPLVVNGDRRGALSAVSTAPNFFTEHDTEFLATVSRWIAVVAQRAELAEVAVTEASARSRRMAAEQLVTVLAHDFRNLLTPLRARLELLGRRAARDGHDRYVSDAHELMRTVDRLNSLVKDLMDTARLEQGLFALNPEPVDLVALTNQTVTDFATSTTSVKVETDVDELVVCADPIRLRQVLENLLSNAFKVQPPGVPLTISLANDDTSATVVIADQGPGISAEVRPRLFQLFGAETGSTGLGVGLYLARGIVEAHGGSIEVETGESTGSRFIIRVPLESRSAPSNITIATNGTAAGASAAH
jgi:two-component system, OmpR family, sensor kinase